jgi:S1-C subfamily serine protease
VTLIRFATVAILCALAGCISTMHVQTPPPSAGRLRIQYESCASTRGLLITHVEPGFAASRAGIVEGDVLAAVDGAPVSYELPLESVLAPRRPGDVVHVSFARLGQMHVEVTLDGPSEVAITTTGYTLGRCDWGL